MPTLVQFLWIAGGAALGANARYLVGIWAGGRLGAMFPYGTLIVNVTGSLLLGFLLALSTERLTTSPEMRLFIATGFLGSYTTFSTYAVESVTLIREGSILLGVANIVGNSLIGLSCALAGLLLARLIV